jgi:hypothetical protein
MNDKNKVPPNVVPQKGLHFSGTWNVQLFNAETGKKELDQTQKNIVVDVAATTMCSGTGPSAFSVLHLGSTPVSGLFPPSTNDTHLQEDINLNGYPTSHIYPIASNSFAFEKQATLAATDAVGTLTEAGLFTPDGTMFNHVLFSPPIVKTNLQTAFITTTISLLRV